MEQETSLAQSLRVLDGNAELDAACKRVLSEKIVLAWIMKSCLEEYKDSTVQEIAERYILGTPAVDDLPMLPDETNRPTRIRSVGQEDASLTEHTITYDIRFLAAVPSTSEPIRLIINVEAQNKFNAGYPLLKRAIYYCSRLISSQYGVEFTDAQYGKIRKVYSIWLCARPPKERRNTITRYRMVEENMIGHVQEPKSSYDLLTVVMMCLGSAEDDNYGGILKMLDVLMSNNFQIEEKKQILQKDFDLVMSKTMEMEVQNMCNLSEGVWQRGMEKGRAEGRTETWTDAIRSLMKNMKLSVDQAMTALNVPESDRPKYRELLEQKS